MILLRAELAMHLPTKDVALNGDMLAVQSERKHLRRFKTRRFQASTRNKHRTRQQSSVDSLSTGLRTMVIYGCKNYPFFVLHFAFCVLTAAFYFNWCVLTSQLCGVIGYTFTGGAFDLYGCHATNIYI